MNKHQAELIPHRPGYYEFAEKVSKALQRTADTVALVSSEDSSYESDEGGEDTGYCYLYNGFKLPCCYLVRYSVGHFGGTYIISFVLCSILLRWKSVTFPGRWGTITAEDLVCLSPRQMLTDKMVNYYMNHLVDSKLFNKKNTPLIIFSTFMYTKMKLYQELNVARAKRTKVCVSASLFCVKYNRVSP